MSTTNNAMLTTNNNATAKVVYTRGGAVIGNKITSLLDVFQRDSFLDLGCSTTVIYVARMVGSLATPAASALLALNAPQRIVSVPRRLAAPPPCTPTRRPKLGSRRAPRKNSFKREWVGALEVVLNLGALEVVLNQRKKFPRISRPARSTMRLLSPKEIEAVERNAARVFAVNPPARAPRASRSLSAAEIRQIEANAPTASIREVAAIATTAPARARFTVRALSVAEIAEALVIDAAIWEHASLRTVEVNPKPETRSPKHETRSPKPATRSAPPETRNPKPALNPETQTLTPAP